jgi:hypothetical protein
VPCKHLAAVCYVLAEAFDDDPFAMLAWRGRNRDTLLAALRSAGQHGAGQHGAGQHGAGAPTPVKASAKDADVASATRAVLADVAGPPLTAAGDFWSPGLSQARLRALAAPGAAAAAPGLLLRMFDPPPLTVRGKDLRTVLSAAYEQLDRQADSELFTVQNRRPVAGRPGQLRGKDPGEQSAQPGGARSHRARSACPLDSGGSYGAAHEPVLPWKFRLTRNFRAAMGYRNFRIGRMFRVNEHEGRRPGREGNKPSEPCGLCGQRDRRGHGWL